MPQKTISITPIILCGGFGSRLWPLSREDLPKQFLRFNSKHSLFQDTVTRMQGERTGVFKFEKPIIATGAEHRYMVAEQLREIDVKADILLEPVRRDSAAAIVSAIAYMVESKREGLCMVVASDHAIPDISAFLDHVELALRGAKEHIVLFGIQPQEASVDYGYISPGDELPTYAPLHRVNKFAEKPSASVAEIYVSKGYLWNSSNFICSPKIFLSEANLLAHEIAAPAISAIKSAKHGDDFIYLDEKQFAAAKSLSIDFAVMEKTARAAVLPSNFPWSDLGTWKSIHTLLDHDADDNATSGGKVQFTHSSNNLVLGEGPLVTVEGLKDVVVVITPDAVLVAALETSASMKVLVEKLKQNHPTLLRKAKS